jgi:hypothetical protein
MVRDRASPGDVASSDGILAIAGRHRVGDIWTATGSSSRARSQSEKMINLNPRRSAGPCLGIRQRMRSAAHSDAIIPFARAGSNSFNDSIIGFIGDRRSHGHRRHAMPRTILRKIASPLVFLAPDESPQLVHGSGHAAHSEPTNFVLPPSRLRGAEHCASTKSAVYGLVRGLQLGRVT